MLLISKVQLEWKSSGLTPSLAEPNFEEALISLHKHAAAKSQRYATLRLWSSACAVILSCNEIRMPYCTIIAIDVPKGCDMLRFIQIYLIRREGSGAERGDLQVPRPRCKQGTGVIVIWGWSGILTQCTFQQARYIASTQAYHAKLRRLDEPSSKVLLSSVYWQCTAGPGCAKTYVLSHSTAKIATLFSFDVWIQTNQAR